MNHLSPRALPLLAVGIFVGLLLGILSTLGVQRLLDGAGVSSRQSETAFQQFLLELAPSRKLILAEVRTNEVFDRLSGARAFFDMIDLPSVEVRASVHVLHRVSLSVAEPSDFRLQAGADSLKLLSPALKIEDPSPDLASLRLEVIKGSLLRNEREVLDELRSEMTVLLKGRSHQTKEFAREVARRELASLIRGWMRTDQPIEVRFADDPTGPVN